MLIRVNERDGDVSPTMNQKRSRSKNGNLVGILFVGIFAGKIAAGLAVLKTILDRRFHQHAAPIVLPLPHPYPLAR